MAHFKNKNTKNKTKRGQDLLLSKFHQGKMPLISKAHSVEFCPIFVHTGNQNLI